MPASFVEIDISTPAFLFDTITGILTQEGFEGFWEDGDTLRCYIPSSKWKAARLEPLRDQMAGLARAQGMPPPRVSAAPVPDRNWNEEWEATITPIKATERIVIAPTWHPYNAQAGEIVITIDPKMSFGTGYHETTRLMLRLLERSVRPGIRVIDVGTGTGVLAIAAVRLGAASALGVDIDEWSYENAVENVKLNGLPSSIEIKLGGVEALPNEPVDLIAANIQKNVIEVMLPDLAARLTSEGTLLLSGLLITDRESLLATFIRLRLSVELEMTENEWIAFSLILSP